MANEKNISRVYKVKMVVSTPANWVSKDDVEQVIADILQTHTDAYVEIITAEPLDILSRRDNLEKI
jgi:hypothetical protein